MNGQPKFVTKKVIAFRVLWGDYFFSEFMYDTMTADTILSIVQFIIMISKSLIKFRHTSLRLAIRFFHRSCRTNG